MSPTWDLLISTVIGGMLMVAIFTLNANLSTASYEGSRDYSVQMATITFAQIIEYDFNKIGYHAAVPKITYADSTDFTYKSDFDKSGAVKLVRYTAGTTVDAPTTINPRDFPIYTRINGALRYTNNFGITALRFTFRDSTGRKIPYPITVTDSLKKIKQIQVRATLQSFYPVDTTYSSTYWERTFIPKNL